MQIIICYKLEHKNLITLNIGAKTAEPASPYSNAVISWGKILCLQTLSGKLSKCGVKLEKNLFFSFLSFIWISSKKSNVSTKSFLKYPPSFRHLVIISAGLGLEAGLEPISST